MSEISTGNFTGSTLVIDPATGFLTPQDNQVIQKRENGQGTLNAPGALHGNGPLAVFDANKKIEFLAKLVECVPNFSKASKFVGITRTTFKNHYQIDKKFRECVDEIVNASVDEIEEIRFKLSQAPNQTLDRMAVLNAYRRETYNPSIDINVKHEMPYEDAMKRSKHIGNVIDGQIVSAVKEMKRANEKASE